MSEKKDYIRYFETESEYNNARENDYYEPWVSYVESVDGVNYNMTEEERKQMLYSTPLTYVMLSDGNITCTGESLTIEYKLNNGEWTSITGGYDYDDVLAPRISVVSGDTVQFRGNNSQYGEGETDVEIANFLPLTQLFVDGLFKVKGNIMSMINSTNFSTLKTFGANSWDSLAAFFCYCTGLTDASELLLPATTLGHRCYAAMFEGCTSLTTAPQLPAIALTDNCYQSMFAGCTSLIIAPELPATTLDDNCYYYMFRGCTSLTQAPELPATTLTDGCYGEMFSDCTSLTTAPQLPATTLVYDCYFWMFKGCSNLNYIKCLATNKSAANCTYNWVNGVAATGTFVKAPNMTGWTTGISGIPTGWTVQNAS